MPLAELESCAVVLAPRVQFTPPINTVPVASAGRNTPLARVCSLEHGVFAEE